MSNLSNAPEKVLYDDFGNILVCRTQAQSDEYFKNVIGQCVKWQKEKLIRCKTKIVVSDKTIANLFHNRFKAHALPIISKEFGRKIISTTRLTKIEFEMFVAEAFLYLASRKIDIYEFEKRRK